MKIPKVLNKYKDIIPKDAINIMRPSKWGNPFKIGQIYQGRKMTRKDTIEAYKDWLIYSDVGYKLLAQINELKNKDLVCCCAPKACHGDILIKLANE